MPHKVFVCVNIGLEILSGFCSGGAIFFCYILPRPWMHDKDLRPSTGHSCMSESWVSAESGGPLHSSLTCFSSPPATRTQLCAVPLHLLTPPPPPVPLFPLSALRRPVLSKMDVCIPRADGPVVARRARLTL